MDDDATLHEFITATTAVALAKAQSRGAGAEHALHARVAFNEIRALMERCGAARIDVDHCGVLYICEIKSTATYRVPRPEAIVAAIRESLLGVVPPITGHPIHPQEASPESLQHLTAATVQGLQQRFVTSHQTLSIRKSNRKTPEGSVVSAEIRTLVSAEFARYQYARAEVSAITKPLQMRVRFAQAHLESSEIKVRRLMDERAPESGSLLFPSSQAALEGAPAPETDVHCVGHKSHLVLRHRTVLKTPRLKFDDLTGVVSGVLAHISGDQQTGSAESSAGLEPLVLRAVESVCTARAVRRDELSVDHVPTYTTAVKLSETNKLVPM